MVEETSFFDQPCLACVGLEDVYKRQGVHQPDSGLMLLEGEKITLRSTEDSAKLGIAAIYQHVDVYKRQAYRSAGKRNRKSRRQSQPRSDDRRAGERFERRNPRIH